MRRSSQAPAAAGAALVCGRRRCSASSSELPLGHCASAVQPSIARQRLDWVMGRARGRQIRQSELNPGSWEMRFTTAAASSLTPSILAPIGFRVARSTLSSGNRTHPSAEIVILSAGAPGLRGSFARQTKAPGWSSGDHRHRRLRVRSCGFAANPEWSGNRRAIGRRHRLPARNIGHPAERRPRRSGALPAGRGDVACGSLCASCAADWRLLLFLPRPAR